MRPLEIILAILLAVYLAGQIFSKQRHNWIPWLAPAGLFIILIHLIVEGYRWQMIPLYFFAVLVSAGLLFSRFRQAKTSPRHRGWIITGAISGLFLLFLAMALPILLPVPQTPLPTGPYKIGTINRHFIDQSREEIYANESGKPHELLVQVWYPAAPDAKGQTALWLSPIDVMGPAIAEWIELPGYFLDHIRYSHSHALQDVPIASADLPFPILVFSHGWGGFRAQNTYQAEELASHGYVVIAVQHTYGAIATVFPDGRIAKINPQALPSGLSENEYRLAANRLISQWAADLSFVLDQFDKFNHFDPESRFFDHLDMQQVGVFGHSTGGGAAIEWCAQDTRCKALLAMDAYLTPVSENTIKNGLSQPSFFLFSESWPSDINNSLFERLSANLSEGRAFTILGTSHYDFTDLPMFSPLAPQLGLKDPLNGKRALRIINDFSLAFFNQYLKGIQNPLANGFTDGYPEVVIRK